MSLEYEKLVEGFRKKISGNVESKVLSPEEMQAEIAAVQDGAVSSFDYPREMQDKLMGAIIDDAQAAGETPVISTIIAQAGKKRRGRPPGSKNRPKVK